MLVIAAGARFGEYSQIFRIGFRPSRVQARHKERRSPNRRRRMFFLPKSKPCPLPESSGKRGTSWATARKLFGPNSDRGEDVSVLVIFSFSGLALSLLAIERFPALVAAIAACP